MSPPLPHPYAGPAGLHALSPAGRKVLAIWSPRPGPPTVALQACHEGESKSEGGCGGLGGEEGVKSGREVEARES